MHLENFMLKSGGQENEGLRPANKVARCEVYSEGQQGQAFCRQLMHLERCSSFETILYYCEVCDFFAFTTQDKNLL